MCLMVLVDLKLVSLLAMMELGQPNLLPTWLDPLVHAVESFPPPTRGLGRMGIAAAASALAASILRV
jgi:hypothetical protein